jgi:EAL domain-containing protein (putative c-di-GMP-specific phosphodiesterase class I)/GGDEF domain-containing protein
MLLAEKKEREYRFKLALRIGLPIFSLVLVLVSSTLIKNYEVFYGSFFFEVIFLLVFSIYFIFYIIYSGFNEQITDPVSKTFSREYLLKYLKKMIKKNDDYTLILISIENLNDINKIYGLKNGDKTLKVVANWIGTYLLNQGIDNAPIGHIKGGDFIVGLKEKKEKYTTMLEMMCIKATEFNIDDIEIKISGAITDTSYSKELNYLFENLFELQEINKRKKGSFKDENIDPNELETLVIRAISERSIIINSQNIYNDDKVIMSEYFIKLKTLDGKYIHPKRYRKVINKLGLNVDYEKMILEEILVNHRKFSTKRFALNISASSLRNDTFLHFLRNLLKENQNAYEKIVFIISEQEYYSFTGRFNSIINSLKSLNISIAVDKIGSYHTSFLYLRELDIDIIRFDTYYSNEEKISEQASIIEGFNKMAQDKGIKTWMKNIEDEESLQNIKKFNIDYIQGRHLSLPNKIYET